MLVMILVFLKFAQYQVLNFVYPNQNTLAGLYFFIFFNSKFALGRHCLQIFKIGFRVKFFKFEQIKSEVRCLDA